MTRYYTSDTHFGHRNVISYCNRPFTDVDDMDETLIERWNTKVRPNDEVIHLGDFALCNSERIEKVLQRLNGRIHLVYGNHDKQIKTNKKLQAYFAKCSFYHELYEIDEDYPKGRVPIILSHYPMLSWNKRHHGSIQLHGHCHGTLTIDNSAKRMDIGVDCTNYYPISYNDIKKYMLDKSISTVDGHDI